jgi:hypothetical protein
MAPTGAAAQSSPAPVNIGTAGNFAILSKTGISTTGTSHITGDIGVSPAAATYITGFGLTMDVSGAFSTSSLVVGNVHAADYSFPTPTMMTAAVSDMETAYTGAAGRTSPDFTELYAGDITGKTLTRGLYKWSTAVLVSVGGVTISGTSNDVWIFQIAQNMELADGAVVTLAGGAQASNIFWQVAGQVTLGTTAAMKGIILCKTAIIMRTGAALNGRALAQTAITLDADVVSGPTAVTAAGRGLAPQKYSLFRNYSDQSHGFIGGSNERGTVRTLNILGQEVAALSGCEATAGGRNQTQIHTNGLAKGSHFIKMEANGTVQMKRIRPGR